MVCSSCLRVGSETNVSGSTSMSTCGAPCRCSTGKMTMTPSRNALGRLGAHVFTVALLVVSLIGISTVRSGSAQAYPDPSPTGHLDALELTPNGLHVAGWARDPNTTTAIRVAVSSDGSSFIPLVASNPVTGVGNYGFDHTYLRPAGTHKMCATALNVGAGTNRLLGCKTITFGSSL